MVRERKENKCELYISNISGKYKKLTSLKYDTV